MAARKGASPRQRPNASSGNFDAAAVAAMLPKPGGKEILRSSFALQLFLYFHGWYYLLFFIGETAAFVYKGISLRYPTNLFAYEALLLLLLLGMEVARNSFGRSGNLTESFSLVAVSLFLAAPCVLAYGYLLYYQTYVVRLEVVLTIVSLLFIISEMTFSVISMISWLK
uniref:Transmembrane protein 216 n=1 Tax=Trichuris muris TaxID=70415 RepID=A0A5S6QFH0_TRIMR